MPRRFRILGALGTGTFAPLLAEEQWGSACRRVVLARPASEEVAPIAAVASDQVVGEEGRVVLDGRALGIYAYAPGIDLDQVAGDIGLSAPVAETLRARVLQVLEQAPIAHGDLRPANIRIDGSGRVRLVGFRGGSADDQATLDAMLRDLRADGPGAPTSLEALVDQAPQDPLAHQWSGRTIAEEVETPGVPVEVRTAAIAALTMILGLLAGWFLVPR